MSLVTHIDTGGPHLFNSRHTQPPWEQQLGVCSAHHAQMVINRLVALRPTTTSASDQ
jgi:hypothetical protein